MDYYEILRTADGVGILPFITIPKLPGDRVIRFERHIHRLDKLAMYYYGNPFYDKLILFANPSYTMDAEIPDGALLRIPGPLNAVLKIFEDEMLRQRDYL